MVMVANKRIMEYYLEVGKETEIKGWFMRVLCVEKCISRDFVRLIMETKVSITDPFTGVERLVEEEDARVWKFKVVRTGEIYSGDGEYVGSSEDWHVFRISL